MIGAQVRAAGGVVWRRGRHGLEVVVVHRPRYDDWSLPKGKAEIGEDDLQTALREVAEETGYTCRPGRHVGDIAYHDRAGRPKRVGYWLMEPLSGEFVANDEVDELAWLTPPEAEHRLSYADERNLLRTVVAQEWPEAG